jgi:hypothetical protein
MKKQGGKGDLEAGLKRGSWENHGWEDLYLFRMPALSNEIR